MKQDEKRIKSVNEESLKALLSKDVSKSMQESIKQKIKDIKEVKK